jgi:phage baseplate assembly protein V
VDVTAVSVARDLAADCGLEVQTEHEGPSWPRVIQHNRSDLEVLQHLLQRAGLYFSVRQQVMHVMTLEGVGPAVELSFGEQLIEARMEINADSICQTVEACGWDPLGADRHYASASEPRVGRNVAASATSEATGGHGERTLAGGEFLNADHALALAQAELDRRVGRLVTLWAVATGEPRLRPGAWVDITTPARDLAGRYVVTEATHTLDEQRGFVSEISTAVPTPPRHAEVLRTTLGVVADVADPAGLGRVRVAMPAIGDLETDWIEVLMPAAGPAKGFITMPAPGDRVLVLLGGPEASQAIVLGGMYGDTPPPDPGIDGDRVVRYTLVTPSGQRVMLADDTHTLRLEDGNGNQVELSPQAVRIDAVVDVEMSAPGRRLLFRGAAIDFEKA